eukprot:gene11712-15678_t
MIVLLKLLLSSQIVHAVIQKFTLVLENKALPNNDKIQITVNGTVPGPPIYVTLGNDVEVQVINKINDNSATLHWHGMHHRGTPYSDGVINVTQCPITNVVGFNSMVYTFTPDTAGTYWYHGHFKGQHADGLYGPLIVTDVNQQQILAQKGAVYAPEEDRWTWMIGDWYNDKYEDILPWYLSSQSGGDEPTPNNITVNGKFTEKLVISDVSKSNGPVRVRVINAGVFSMFNISVDGMPLKIIEIDGVAVTPFTVSYVLLNVAQRVSFILDWNNLHQSLQPYSSIWFRFNSIKEMFPTYDPTLADDGIYGYGTNISLNTEFKGLISFFEVPSYTAVPVLNDVPAPLDDNLLQASPLVSSYIPKAPTMSLYFEIVFAENSNGINLPYLNGVNNIETTTSSSTSTCNSYTLQKFYKKNSPTDSKGVPYLIPYNAVVEILINNTDGGEHPFHFHGYSFWVIATSDLPDAESTYKGSSVVRDVVSVPALGWAKILFVADNPGVWIFHCHIDWHMTAGLITTIVVAPDQIQSSIKPINPSMPLACVAPNAVFPTPMPTAQPTASPSFRSSYFPSVAASLPAKLSPVNNKQTAPPTKSKGSP